MIKARMYDTQLDKFIGVKLPIANSQYGYWNPSIVSVEQVKSNLMNLILTRRNERVMEPNFYCGIHDLLFEPLNKTETEQTAKDMIREAIKTWMGYVDIAELEVKSESIIDENRLTIYIKFSIDNEIYEELVFKITGGK